MLHHTKSEKEKESKVFVASLVTCDTVWNYENPIRQT